MAYVVKNWQASPKPDTNGEYIRISGRKEGIVAWLLSWVGIDPTVHMTATAKNFRLEERTFWGYSSRTIPISRISEIRDGFARAWLAPCIFWALSVFSLVCALSGSGSTMAALVGTVVLFGIGYAIYYFYRVLVVGVVGTGGHPATISFKPSFIEGKGVDDKAAEEVGRIIQALMDNVS